MCSGSKRKPSTVELIMQEVFQTKKEENLCGCSILLELSASDDLIGFRREVEEKGADVDETSPWYGRRIGSKKMGFEERTPLMIAALFGNMEVLKYILETGSVNINRACGSDGATAVHCAASGGSASSPEVVKLLLDASADANSFDANGNRPGDVIAPAWKSCNSRRKTLEMMLNGCTGIGEVCVSSGIGEEHQQPISTPQASKDGIEKKEYPIDLSLPDINNGVYGTDEFRMYTFKVKPCSRAYSHDWTECPFVHPGENARRRDPRKYHYSCVPCPEFRKGTCRQGDACEYAHGVFECWLHPAQYRTRLCKDETGCTRRVCFFAHKPEELRPLYASTGSAVPSPRSFSASASPLDMSAISPLSLGTPSALLSTTSTPPMSPSASSSPMWQNQSSFVPPILQLPGSRLKSTLSARDMDLDLELLALESCRQQQQQQQQQLMDEISSLSSQSSQSGWSNSLATAAALAAAAANSGGRSVEHSRLGAVKPANLEDAFRSLDSPMLSQLHGLSLNAAAAQMQSPTGSQIRQNVNQQIRSSYPTNMSSPMRTPPSFGHDSAAAAAVAVMNSRSSAFTKRSQSFIDRGAANRHVGLTASMTSAAAVPSTLSDWGSPDGKLDWGIQGEELNKLRKSASFGLRNNNNGSSGVAGGAASPRRPTSGEPDVSWVQSLVKDVPPGGVGRFGSDEQVSSGGLEMLPAWAEQLYMEQEQMVA